MTQAVCVAAKGRRIQSVATAIVAASAMLWASPAFGAPPTGPAPSVYSPLSSTAPIPTSAGVDRAIGNKTKDRALGAFSMLVIDPVTERTLFNDDGDRRRIPASVNKILTGAAALSALGPSSRLTTKAQIQGTTVYLVGGGDPLMPRAKGSGSLKELARISAQSLKSRGLSSITLIFDDSLFSGPALGPNWKSTYPRLGVAAPVSALSVGGARIRPGAISRVNNPARQAAELFAQRLRNQGIKVAKIRKGQTPTAAQTIAQIQSEPISKIVEVMIRDSDNDVAEILAHLVGVRVKGDGSFAGGAQAMTSVLSGKGIDTRELKLADGSGLSTGNRVSAQVVAEILVDMVRGDQPQWAAIASGLPVAAETGTLEDRFDSRGTRAGAGVVLAKTGSLTGVSSLAGTVKDRDGRLLVFVMMGNKVPSLFSARNSMDQIAARLAKCGCQ